KLETLFISPSGGSRCKGLLCLWLLSRHSPAVPLKRLIQPLKRLLPKKRHLRLLSTSLATKNIEPIATKQRRRPKRPKVQELPPRRLSRSGSIEILKGGGGQTTASFSIGCPPPPAFSRRASVNRECR